VNEFWWGFASGVIATLAVVQIAVSVKFYRAAFKPDENRTGIYEDWRDS